MFLLKKWNKLNEWMNEWMNEWNVYSLKFVTFVNENRNGYIVSGHVKI